MKQEKDLKKVYVFSNQFGGNIVYLNKKYLLSISYTVKSRLQTGHPFAIIGPQMYMFIALYFKNQKILHQNIKVKKKKNSLGRKSKSEDRARLDPRFQMALIGRNRGVAALLVLSNLAQLFLPPVLCQLASHVYMSGSSPVAI